MTAVAPGSVLRRGSAALAVVALLLAACDDGGPAPPPRAGRDDGLRRIPLRAGEVPNHLQPDPDATGPIRSIRDLVPSRSAVPTLPRLPAGLPGAFRDGYETGYRASVEDGEAGGLTSVSSTVLRFDDQRAAGRFLAYLHDIQVGRNAVDGREELPAEGLGDEGYGWHLDVPLGESYGYAWRAGSMVLTVTVGAAQGAVDAERPLALARRLDGRAG